MTINQLAKVSEEDLAGAAVDAVPAGYKKTEVGVIPEDWDAKQLRDLFVLKNGYSFKGDFFSNKGPIVLTPGNFKLDGGLYFEKRNTKYYESEYPKGYEFEKGDLVIVMTDLTPDCNLLGKPAFVESDEKILHNQRIGKVTQLVKNWESRFLFYTLLSPIYLSAIKNAATGSTVRHTSPNTIATAWIAEPPKKEQTAIANALSDVDALLSELEKLIAKKQAIKTATLQQLLTGRTRLPQFALQKNGIQKGLKRNNIGEIQEGWNSISIGQNATLKARIGWQALTTKEYQTTGEIFLVTGTDFDAGAVKWERCFYVNEWRYKQDSNIQLIDDDVLITKDGTIGKVGYVTALTKPATLNSGVFVVRPKDNSFVPRYLFYVLTSTLFDDFMNRIKAGSTITHLYQKDFVNFEFLAPSLEEQTAIATILSDMDEEIQALEHRLGKARQIKQGMMQQLLTGKTRLVTGATGQIGNAG